MTQVRLATAADVDRLVRLLERLASDDPVGDQPWHAAALQRWWEAQAPRHVAFLAVSADDQAVGMAWLAITARVPRPGRLDRLCGDVQSVYVVPEHRGRGIGSDLLGSVLEHARTLRLEHVTVHSNARAVGLYQRAGFAASPVLLLKHDVQNAT